MPSRRHRLLRLCALFAVSLTVAACATSARPAHAGTLRETRPVLPGPGGAVPADAPRRGGYYLDDGPGDGPPVDPASVPDAIPLDEAPLPNANRPYEALGEVYFPDTSALPFSERGVATWYGRRFNGKRTSSGEAYDMYGMTAAHKILPIPSYARVTDVVTGKSVVVRVNDRGPFHPGRVIDLSYTAAAKLGFAGRGSAEVLVERVFPAGLSDLPPNASSVLSPAPTPIVAQAPVVAQAPATGSSAAGAAPLTAASPGPLASSAGSSAAVTAPAATGDLSSSGGGGAVSTVGQGLSKLGKGLFLQLGAFRDATNAQHLLEQARGALRGLESFLRLEVEGGVNRVRLGPFPSAQEQNAAAGAVERNLHMKPGLVGP